MQFLNIIWTINSLFIQIIIYFIKFLIYLSKLFWIIIWIKFTSIFSNQLKSNLKKPLELLEKKYNLRKKYYDIIADLKERIKIKKFGISSSLSEGICNIENELIYSKRININEKLDFLDNNFNLQYSFSDIIIGWKIDSFESLNRELNVENSPILKKEINFYFIRSFDIFGTGYNIEIFFMKYPE